MKKALGTMETILIGAMVCLIAFGSFTIFNKIKLKLTGLSNVGVTETTGSLAYVPKIITPKPDLNINKDLDTTITAETNIDNCEKYPIDTPATRNNGNGKVLLKPLVYIFIPAAYAIPRQTDYFSEVRYSHICVVYKDKKGPYVLVETTGSTGIWQRVYLDDNTNSTGKDAKDCAGKLTSGKVCYTETGEIVTCPQTGKIVVSTPSSSGQVREKNYNYNLTTKTLTVPTL